MPTAAALTWDAVGEHLYETGVDQVALYVMNGNTYGDGVAWNGVTAITESPSGADATDIYADNIKYLSLRSAENFGATIEAYSSPDEFDQCDGMATPATGVTIRQQTRKPFGLAYRTLVGNDTQSNDHGYQIHLIYNATAAPSEKAYQTVNESPEAITLSWELSTTPIAIADHPELKPTAHITIDSTKVDATKLESFLAIIYGSTQANARLPLPAEVISHFSGKIGE